MSKFLKQPVTPFHVNQGYGFNLPCCEDKPIEVSKRNIVTGKNNTTCPVGYVKLYPLLNLPNGHNGLDLQAYHHQPVYAACEGYVEEVQTEEARGLGLGIVSQQKYPCVETGTDSQFKVRYWHLMSFNVKKGDIVKQGDLIGYADNTGYSSGDHLHFEIKPINFWNGQIVNTLQNNGFYGAIDPLPYLNIISEEEQFHLDHPELDKSVTKEQYTFRQRLFNYFKKLFGY